MKSFGPYSQWYHLNLLIAQEVKLSSDFFLTSHKAEEERRKGQEVQE